MPPRATASPLKRSATGAHISAKAKIGGPCSTAVSQWRTTGMTAAIAAVLGKCRAQSRAMRQGASHRLAGNEAKAQHLEHRATSGGLVTAKDRTAKAKELMAKRREGKAAAGKTPKAEDTPRSPYTDAQIARPSARPVPLERSPEAAAYKAAEPALKTAYAKIASGRSSTKSGTIAAKLSKYEQQRIADIHRVRKNKRSSPEELKLNHETARANIKQGRLDRVRQMGLSIPRKDVEKRKAAAERVHANRATLQATPSAQAKLAEQSARAAVRERQRFGLFGGELPTERPYEASKGAVKPSLREQVEANRAAKGTRDERVDKILARAKAINERLNSVGNIVTQSREQRTKNRDRGFSVTDRANNLERSEQARRGSAIRTQDARRIKQLRAAKTIEQHLAANPNLRTNQYEGYEAATRIKVPVGKGILVKNGGVNGPRYFTLTPESFSKSGIDSIRAKYNEMYPRSARLRRIYGKSRTARTG